MPVDTLGLYELIAPEFLAGFTFPPHIDSYLSKLGVDELRTAFSDNAIVYTGRCSFMGGGGASPTPIHHDPSGAVFEWNDVTIDFCLTVPRIGSAVINTAVNTVANAPINQSALKDVLAKMGTSNATPTDFPSFAFRLELLITALTFHLGDDWIPAKVDADFHVVPDEKWPNKDVRFVLPKVILEYSQDADFNNPPTFRLRSWGSSGFDVPADLGAGELVRMEPEIALHKCGRFGFGVSQVILDLSEDSTPPEILQHFGIDEGWQGLYIKSARFFYSDKNKDFALNFGVNDVLISFAGEVSLEARVDLLFESSLTVNVEIYEGARKIDFNRGVENPANIWTGGSATIPNSGVIQVQAIGGTPPWTTSVIFQQQGQGPVELWSNERRDARFTPPPNNPKTGTLTVTVTDSASPQPKQFRQTLTLNVVVPPSRQQGGPFDNPELGTRRPATFTYDPPGQGALPQGYRITHVPSSSGTLEVLLIEGGTGIPTVQIDDNTPVAVNANRLVFVDVPRVTTGASSRRVNVSWPTSTAMPNTFELFFDYDKPENDVAVSTYLTGSPTPADTRFSTSRVPDRTNGQPLPGAENLRGRSALEWWLNNALASKSVNIVASASYEGHPDRAPYNLALSQRRSLVAEGIINGVGLTVGTSTEVGQQPAEEADPDRVGDPNDRVARITGTPKPGQAAVNASGRLSRPADQVPPSPLPPVIVTPTPPPPASNRKPDVIKRLSFRVRLERNVPVLLEISGEIDFETKMEETLHAQPSVPANGHIAGRNLPAASSNPNPQDGVVDFKLLIVYDTATNDLTESLYLGAHSEDKDGLYQITSDGTDEFKNIVGSLLIFAPITNAAAGALDPDSAGDWVAMAVSLAVPVTIGGLGIIRTRRVTLYGGELILRQNVPPGASAQFTDSGVVFDYGVEFGIEISQLNIKSTRPLKVRYRAIGFNLHWGDPVTYQPIFDTSKGYDIDLSDPGLFNLPDPLGDLLQVLGARIARFNPLTLELDIALKADLGVITVDRFKVKVPLDNPPSAPMILPSGVRVDIPAALRGSGYVNILPDGFEGTIDVTVVPIKLRIAASVGVQQITGPRRATAFFLGLLVEFPVPIVLGITGLGIYGFNGLFAMHYKRLEPASEPGSPVGPALSWLQDSYDNGAGPIDVHFWGPELDRWSFGIGALLGTVEGGFLLNLQGMFMLELPGPRILILVQAKIITPLPEMGKGNLTVGILGVLDLNFLAGSITLGVLIELNMIKELIQIRIPIEIYFNWSQSKKWHVWLGTIQVPVSAKVFNLVRASGYFMIGGEDIKPFPPGTDLKLPGIAVALGIAAELVWGSKAIAIYVRVAAGVDLGVSFQPKLFMVGRVFLEGELRLIILSIGVHGEFLIKAPDPVYLEVHICGEIDLFFFKIEACVDFKIGDDHVPLPPDDLFKGMYLQSYAPVIVSGQGGERPIDATLGDAAIFKPGDSEPDLDQLPVVPVDTVPVLQLLFSPKVDGASTFSEPLKISPGLTGDDGKVKVGGGRRVQYTLTSLSIEPRLPGSTPKPPATWRKEQDPSNSSSVTAINLALFSRSPVTANYALERSNELNKQVEYLFGDICRPPAPPVCVLWTFCKQRLGPSGHGWLLRGDAWPDPPGTTRDKPVETLCDVEEPPFDVIDGQANELARAAGLPFLLPAMVVGENIVGTTTAPDLPCRRALQLPDSAQLKPRQPLQVSPELKQAAAELTAKQFVTVKTGAANRVRFLLAVHQSVFPQVIFRELDSKGKVVRDTPLPALNPVVVINNANLPPEWTDATKPWADEVVPALAFVKQTYPSLSRLLVGLKPNPKTTQIRIFMDRPNPDLRPPVALLIAFEVCSKAEQDRFEIATAIQKGKLETLVGFLDGGKPVPLLEPSTTYTITAKYDARVFDADNNEEVREARVQSFRFRTAGPDKPLFPLQPLPASAPNPTKPKAPALPKPERLDPWVLGTAPDIGERFCFYKDPVRIVFNSASIIQLFAKNGKRLRMELRAADGLVESSHTVENFDAVVSGFSSPFYEALQALIKSGALRDCLRLEGKDYENISWTAPVKLRPLMNYTLDIVTDPPLPVPNGQNQPKPQAVVPLFRRSFSTGTFASMGDFALDLARSKVLHRPLNTAIGGLASAGAVTDQQMQDALSAAGEEVLGPAKEGRMKIYWTKQGNQPYKAHAILIDSREPLWRTRSEPKYEALDPQVDPEFRIVTPQIVTTLEMTGSDNIERIVHSTGGMRAVIFFKNTFVGGRVRLQLHRPASTLYSTVDKVVQIIDLDIGPVAPWEDDEP